MNSRCGGRRLDNGVLPVGCQHQQQRIVQLLDGLLTRLDAGLPRHHHVNDDNVGFQSLNLRGFKPLPCSAIQFHQP